MTSVVFLRFYQTRTRTPVMYVTVLPAFMTIRIAPLWIALHPYILYGCPLKPRKVPVCGGAVAAVSLGVLRSGAEQGGPLTPTHATCRVLRGQGWSELE